ncbi:hypothetical protein Ddye_008403 [Dipteronia dyeriana]|uniref:MD-2-related lipid-recognition domain-containing protein n=1 Tax=Dipteronia dyeriana TaxID=168575 RepID=A0AAD9X9C2_9ROSI|nr:hypothetical protein Ddye_008403 [Dipteronia dyeriana]
MEMIKCKLAIVLSLFLTAALTQATDVKYCTKKAYAVKVKGVDISPFPITRGKETTFSISATADDRISGGKLVIDVAYFGWSIHSETHELCDETSCPVSSGNFVVAHSQVLPGFTPPGSYTLKMRMLDEDKQELTCITFDFSIGFLSETDTLADS